MKLPLSFYQQDDVVGLARELLGMRLCVRTPTSKSGVLSALITETEAYGGAEDKGCHGYNNRRTTRTEPLFAPGGISYVYLCYGLHHLFNVVTGPPDVPMAVLIRAVIVEPGSASEAIVGRRRRGVPRKLWSNGPGKVSTSLGITTKQHNGLSLGADQVWLEMTGITVKDSEVNITPRIGIDYAEEWIPAPRRFVFNHAS